MINFPENDILKPTNIDQVITYGIFLQLARVSV